MRRTVIVVALAAVVGVVLTASLVAGLVLVAIPVLTPGTRATETLAPQTAPSGWPTPGPIAWSACRGDLALAEAEAECAVVPVPLDWSDPTGGEEVALALSRVRHTDDRFEGVMLANPGGPGGSGLRLATMGQQVPGGIGDRYDWIGFDPRGTGASRPRLTCDGDYANGPRPAYSPATDETIAAWRERSEAYAEDCAANGELLEHMKTEDLAKDLEYLRIALGAERINFYGYSYGTYLGAVYATLYPDRVDRMVLDSTVDPTRVWYDANLDQDVAFEVALEAWFDWIADHDRTYGLGSTRAAVEARFSAVAADLDERPAGGVFGSAEWSDTFLYAGYSQGLWSALAEAFAAADRGGDFGPAQQYWRSLNETTDDNGYAGYLAVECTDADWPDDWATWEQDTRRVDAEAPFGTWLNTWFNAPCRTWPAASGTPVEVDGTAAPPILMIGETLDAATPFSGSLRVRRLFPKASLLALPGGTSHAESLSGNGCVDRAVAAYLDSGALPERVAGDGPDLTCDPPPLPEP